MKEILAMLVVLVLVSCGSDRPVLTIKGSDTEVNLSVLLAEVFYKQNNKMVLSVSGGGTGLGIAALLNGLADIANASRPINDFEKQLFLEEGIELIPVVFAQDALVIITNKTINVDSLSTSQLSSIFAGRISNWATLGQPEMPITIYGRQNNSGSHGFLKSRLGIDFALNAREMNGNAQIIEAVKSDAGGIGYVGAGYVIRNGKKIDDDYNIVSIFEEGQPAYSPLDYDAVVSKRYYLQRPLYQYVLKNSMDKAQPFLDFEKSALGKKIIEENGYFPAEKLPQ